MLQSVNKVRQSRIICCNTGQEANVHFLCVISDIIIDDAEELDPEAEEEEGGGNMDDVDRPGKRSGGSADEEEVDDEGDEEEGDEEASEEGEGEEGDMEVDDEEEVE